MSKFQKQLVQMFKKFSKNPAAQKLMEDGLRKFENYRVLAQLKAKDMAEKAKWKSPNKEGKTASSSTSAGSQNSNSSSSSSFQQFFSKFRTFFPTKERIVPFIVANFMGILLCFQLITQLWRVYKQQHHGKPVAVKDNSHIAAYNKHKSSEESSSPHLSKKQRKRKLKEEKEKEKEIAGDRMDTTRSSKDSFLGAGLGGAGAALWREENESSQVSNMSVSPQADEGNGDITLSTDRSSLGSQMLRQEQQQTMSSVEENQLEPDHSSSTSLSHSNHMNTNLGLGFSASNTSSPPIASSVGFGYTIGDPNGGPSASIPPSDPLARESSWFFGRGKAVGGEVMEPLPWDLESKNGGRTA